MAAEHPVHLQQDAQTHVIPQVHWLSQESVTVETVAMLEASDSWIVRSPSGNHPLKTACASRAKQAARQVLASAATMSLRGHFIELSGLLLILANPLNFKLSFPKLGVFSTA